MRTPPLHRRPGQRPGRHTRGLRRRAGGLLVLGLGATLAVAFVPADPVEGTRWASRAIIRARGGTFVTFPGVVLQSGFSDCGPAALATLLRTLGGTPPPLDSIAALAGTGARGTTFAGLARAARILGVPSELVRLDSVALAVLDTPVIAWVDEGHFVTVVSGSSGDALVLDPQAGPYRISLRGLRRFWGGEALLPRPPRNPAGAAGDAFFQGGRK